MALVLGWLALDALLYWLEIWPGVFAATCLLPVVIVGAWVTR